MACTNASLNILEGRNHRLTILPIQLQDIGPTQHFFPACMTWTNPTANYPSFSGISVTWIVVDTLDARKHMSLIWSCMLNIEKDAERLPSSRSPQVTRWSCQTPSGSFSGKNADRNEYLLGMTQGTRKCATNGHVGVIFCVVNLESSSHYFCM